jgi:hypothetical protein
MPGPDRTPKAPASLVYGWLPYDYLQRGLAGDVWTLLHPDCRGSPGFGWRA